VFEEQIGDKETLPTFTAVYRQKKTLKLALIFRMLNAENMSVSSFKLILIEI
jgi:hypothetical protein